VSERISHCRRDAAAIPVSIHAQWVIGSELGFASGSGTRASGSPWVNGPNGVIANPNLSTIWPTMTNWRGAAERRPGAGAGHLGRIRSDQHAHERVQPAQQQIPDVVTHFTGSSVRAFYAGRAHAVLLTDRYATCSNSIGHGCSRAIHSRDGGEPVSSF